MTDCVVCDAPLLKTRGRTQPHCTTPSCNEGYAIYVSMNGPIRKEGDCELWHGRAKCGVPLLTVVQDRSTKNGTRQDYRVLDIRRAQAGLPTASYRQYEQTCGNKACVNVDHSIIRPLKWRKPEHSRELMGHLDAAPLLRRIDASERLIPRHMQGTIQKGRHRGFFTVNKVDELCIDYLGVHPTEIYGEEFFTA